MLAYVVLGSGSRHGLRIGRDSHRSSGDFEVVVDGRGSDADASAASEM